MSRHWTKEQALAICDTRGGLLLSAAAGSGKTAVLVERVLRMLTRKKKPIPADQLMIATFTNEAAKELRHRIDKGLRERLQKDPGNELYRRQQILLQKADISTISAFCGKLVREHFHELDLSADFRIADDSELIQIKDTVIAEVLEEQYQNELDFPLLVEFFCKKDDESLVGEVFKIYEFIRSLPFPFRWLDTQLEKYRVKLPVLETDWGKAILSYCRETLEYAESMMHLAVSMMKADETLAKAYEQGYLTTAQNIHDMLMILENGDWDTFYYTVRDFKPSDVRAPKGYKDDPLKKKVSEIRETVKKKINGLSEKLAGTEADFTEDLNILAPVMRILFDTVKLYDHRYSQAKREKNLVDFSDLEHFTLQLLITQTPEGDQRTALAEALSKDYAYLLIDEYQDTNEVQDLIFSSISRNGENLFMVGDVKQSIYRFRQAMPEIFLQKRDDYARYDKKHYPATLILGKNFRSRETVTDAVNDLFYQLMSRGMGEIDYNSDEELVPEASYLENDSTTELHIIDKKGEKYPEKDVVYEARYVADLIRRMLEEGYQVQDGETMRKCRPGDFCILLRSQKNKATVYADQLNRLGIMTWADTEGAFLSSREVSVLLSLLQTIDNPLADVPLLSVMLSPIFTFTPDDLAKIRLESPKTSLYMAVTNSAEQGDRKSKELLERLTEYRRLSAVLQVNRLMDYILDDTDFIDILQVMPDATQRRANIRLFCSYAEKYSKAGYLGLSGFLRFIVRFQEKNADMKSASKSPEGEDAVRIMSIHGSKGLEFPICILADAGKSFNLQDLYVGGFNGRLGYSMKIRKPDQLKRYTNVPFEAIKLENDRLLKSEEMRVLYVAMTRAREKLIMTMTTGNLKNKLNSLLPAIGEDEKLPHYAVRNVKSFGDWILMAMLRHPDGEPLWRIAQENREYTLPCASEIRLSVSAPPALLEVDQEETKRFEAVADQTLYEVLRERAEYLYPFAEEAILPSKLSVTQITTLKAGKGRISLSKPRFLQEETMTGAERGTAVHTFLQFADFANCQQDLAGEIARMVEQKFITSKQGDAIPLEKLGAFFRSDICAAILNARHAYREYKFMYDLPASELYDYIAGKEAILVQGIADCVIEEADGLTIVDYKTDRASDPAELVAHYTPQLSLYRRALSEQFGKPVKKCVLYSVELEQELEV